jgi:hypothetical protein
VLCGLSEYQENTRSGTLPIYLIEDLTEVGQHFKNLCTNHNLEHRNASQIESAPQTFKIYLELTVA